MKKHSFIQVDFHPSVKLTNAEEAKISKWLGMASLTLEQLIREKKLIHPSWLKNTTSLRVSVLLCGEDKIRKLNRDYRNKDKVTDVLSFPHFPNLRKLKTQDDFTGTVLLLGDLAICHQRAIKQAKEFKVSYWDEFIHLFIHGTIHLLGYDHELSVKEEKLMEDWENQALTLFSKIKKKGP
ncbi:MAG: rRNA maturation RNase YbeY [Bdellovibrionales bacterium]|nr:rRNA maturation RNase YbeY [Bdellovibrionales bacterium]